MRSYPQLKSHLDGTLDGVGGGGGLKYRSQCAGAQAMGGGS